MQVLLRCVVVDISNQILLRKLNAMLSKKNVDAW